MKFYFVHCHPFIVFFRVFYFELDLGLHLHPKVKVADCRLHAQIPIPRQFLPDGSVAVRCLALEAQMFQCGGIEHGVILKYFVIALSSPAVNTALYSCIYYNDVERGVEMVSANEHTRVQSVK